MTVKVAINGYGTIGKRIADAVGLQDDMLVVGVSKFTPNYEAELLLMKEYPLYVPREKKSAFEDLGFVVEGNVSDLIQESEVVIDCTPTNVCSGFAKEYEKSNKKYIFQGGAFMDTVPFHASTNFDAHFGREKARVPAPDITGLCRALKPLEERFSIKGIFGTVLHNVAGPQTPSVGARGVLPSLTPQLGKDGEDHDLNKLFPKIPVQVQTINMPELKLGLHAVYLELAQPVNPLEVIDVFEKTYRIRMVSGESGVTSLGEVEKLAEDLGRCRSELYENVIWRDGIKGNGKNLSFLQSIGIGSVVPENVDCIRALMQVTDDKMTSILKTNKNLNIDI